jgi:hypothetical protein
VTYDQRLDIGAVVRHNYCMTNKPEWDGEFTNTCSCANYDPETDTTTPLDYCDGSCWDEQVDNFYYAVKAWWDNNPSLNEIGKRVWAVDGLPLWNRSVGGHFVADKIDDFIRAVTVNAEWRLCYSLSGDTLHLNLAHHDVPMGRGYTVRYASADELETVY